MKRMPVRSPDAAGLHIVDSHLSTDDVAAAVDGRLPPGRRASIEAHLAICAACRAEVASVSAMVDSAPAPTRRSRWPALASLVAVAAAMLLVLGPVTRRGVDRRVSPADQRGTPSSTEIAVISPTSAGEIDRDSVRFSWHRDEASTYRLFLTDSAGALLFNESTSDTVLGIPASVRLTPGAHYFWYVDALRPDGSSISSPSTSFKIRR
jgi:hypothetical protein